MGIWKDHRDSQTPSFDSRADPTLLPPRGSVPVLLRRPTPLSCTREFERSEESLIVEVHHTDSSQRPTRMEEGKHRKPTVGRISGDLEESMTPSVLSLPGIVTSPFLSRTSPTLPPKHTGVPRLKLLPVSGPDSDLDPKLQPRLNLHLISLYNLQPNLPAEEVRTVLRLYRYKPQVPSTRGGPLLLQTTVDRGTSDPTLCREGGRVVSVRLSM